MVTETYTNGHSTEAITISPPKFLNLELLLRGTAPYLQARFSEKAVDKLAHKHAPGEYDAPEAKKPEQESKRIFGNGLRIVIEDSGESKAESEK